MPELAGIYAIGILTCLLVGAFYLGFLRRRFRAAPYRLLNQNLAQAGWQWSELEGKLIPFNNERLQQEASRVVRSNALVIFLLSGTSWLGLVILSVYILSVQVLARSRTERVLFSSDLCRRPMHGEDVRRFLERENFSSAPSQF